MKAESDKRHPDPNHQEADNYQRHISGSIHVRGEIEAKRPPDLAKEHNTERQEDATHARKTFVVEIITLIVVAIYAGLTAWQGCSTQKAANATTRAADTAEQNFAFTQSEFRMEQRPYLSPVPRPAFAKPASNGIDIGRPFAVLMEKGGDTLSIAVDLRNIGKSPANNSVLTRMEYIFGERDKARQEAKRYQPSYESVPNVVAPGEFITPSTPKLPMTKQQAAWFLNGEWELYIVGAVRYTDIFAPPIDPYVTTYCFKVRASGMSYANCDWSPPDFTSSIK
ncbi:MAG: hypothetical protein WCC37_26090 [Candidatus Sulfotelmatobacter sp.]